MDTIVLHEDEQRRQAAGALKAELVDIMSTTKLQFVRMCKLLREAQQNNYHTVFGYGRFGEWIEKDSDLDISERQAYYLIGITRKAEELGIEIESLSSYRVTELKEIFSLEPKQHATNMCRLLSESPSMTLEEVKAEVAQVKQKEGQEPVSYMTVKIEQSVKEIVNTAFELVRRQHGSSVSEGDSVDLSDSRCLEFVCLAYTQDPNNVQESEEF